jgi:hypothetical protein
LSFATAASLVLLEPGRFVAGCAAFEAFEAPAALATDAATGAARAAEVDGDLFPGGGATLVADVFFAEEEADLACVTFLVGSSEPLPVAFFPPVVFTIAIRPLAWKTNKNCKQTAVNLLL